MSNVFEGTRFCIHTFGCQMNKHDSERVAGMLEGLGSLPVETIEEADIVVFMTCCVREAADTRLYGQVASMKNIPLRDGTPLDKRYIAVGGCIGQRDGDKLLAALPHLDVVFGTHNLGSLPGLLRRAIEQHGRAAEVIEGGAEFSSALPTVREHDWAAWLPITVGCNNFCSYCIVPYVRGREKSRPLDDIAAEARSYVEAGVKEITLLGQNVNSYGRDLYGESAVRGCPSGRGCRGHRAAPLRDEPSEGSHRRGHRAVRHAALAHAGAAPSRAVGLEPHPLGHEPPLHPRALPWPYREASPRPSRHRPVHGHHRGIPRRDRRGLHGHLSPRGGSRLQPGVHVHLLQARGDACCGDGRRHAPRGHPGALRPARGSRPAQGLRGEPDGASAPRWPVLVEGTSKRDDSILAGKSPKNQTVHASGARRRGRRRLWWGASCP